MKILIHNNAGGKVAIGVEGTKEEREQVFNRFYNYGGVNGRLHEMQAEQDGTPGFSYFLGYEEELLAAMQAHIIVSRRFSPADKTFKATYSERNGQKKKKGLVFLSMIEAAAEEEFYSWPRETFLGNDGEPIVFRELDGGAPFEVPEYEE